MSNRGLLLGQKPVTTYKFRVPDRVTTEVVCPVPQLPDVGNLYIEYVAGSLSGQPWLYVQFNGDTTASYCWNLNYTYDTGNAAFEAISVTGIFLNWGTGGTAGHLASGSVMVPGYNEKPPTPAGSPGQVCLVGHGYDPYTTTVQQLTATPGGFWSGPSPIRSCRFFYSTGETFTPGSMFSLRVA